MLPRPPKLLRAIGFDDAPFDRRRGSIVPLPAMERAIAKLPGAPRRLARLRAAGEVHAHAPFFFQVRGGDPREIGPALAHLTDRGHVPEALRLAHLVGSAWIKGESGNSA